MFGGGGGLNPRKMQKMMEQMGIEMEELEAASVTISLSDGTALVFDDPDVTKMEARGQSTYQIVGEPDAADGEAEPAGEAADDADAGDALPEGDVALVVERTGADEADARAALEAEDGDLAAAISRLE